MDLRRFRPFIIIAFVSVLIVFVWFRGGYMLGAGESGLPFYNLDWHLTATSYAWKISMLGNQTSTTVAASPFLWLLSLLEPFLAPFVIQAIVFFLSFFVSGISMYFLTRILFPKVKKRYLLLAVFYYWFNPFTLVNVYNRFINNYIVAFAFYPLVIAIFLYGISRRQYRFAWLIGIASVIFSFALTSVPFVLLLWLTFTVITLAYIILYSRRDWPFLISFYTITFTTFVAMNFWWLGTLYSAGSGHNLDSILSSFFQTNNNYATLKTLSQKLGGFSNLYRLTHGTFFVDTALIWRKIFNSPILRLLEYTGTGMILFVIYKKKRNTSVLLFALLATVGLFLSKGDAEPLGEVFGTLFVNVSAMQVFRNAFEKIGLLVVVSFAPLFAYSGSLFFKRKALFITYSILILVFGFPFWTGIVVSGAVTTEATDTRTYRTKIPKGYDELNTYLRQSPDPYRILALPLDGEGVSYNWPGGGYSGIELSSSIIEKSIVSMNTTIPYFDRSVAYINDIINSHTDFSKLASLLNLKYVMLRSDIDWRFRAMTNPDVTKDFIVSSGYLKNGDFGDLSLFSFPEDSFRPKIWVPEKNIEVNKNLTIKDYFISNGEVGDIVYQKADGMKLPHTYKYLVKPDWTNLLSRHSDYSVEEALATLSHVSHLPGSTLYPLVKYKEELEVNENSSPDTIFVNRLNLLGKRAVEAYMTRHSNLDTISYFGELNALVSQYPGYMYNRPVNAFSGLVSDSLYRHRSLFREIGPEAYRDLNKELTRLGYLVEHFPNTSDNSIGKFLVSSFVVTTPGNYSLVLDGKNLDKYYETEDIRAYINGEKIDKPLVVSNESILIKDITLSSPGTYEIALSEPRHVNLTTSPESLVLNSDKNTKWSTQIKEYDPHSLYEISFVYWIRRGKIIEYNVAFDNDAVNDAMQLMTKSLVDDGQIHEPRSFNDILIPRSGSTAATLSLVANKQNSCPETRILFWDKCDDPGYRRFFDSSVLVELSNLNVSRIFNNNMYLLQEEEVVKFTPPKVSFEFVDPTKYIVHVTDAGSPYTLVFSELYHSGWKAIVDGNPLEPSKHFFVNGYANAWLVDKLGNYDLVINYEPQDTLRRNQTISTIAFIVGCVIFAVSTINLKRK